MKKLFLFLCFVTALSFTGCKSLVTSAPEQWIAKIGEAMVLIEDTKGLIELAKELGMKYVTLVKQKDGTYTPKDHTEKLKDAGNQVSVAPQGLMSTTVTAAPGNEGELVIPIADIIRRTRIVH